MRFSLVSTCYNERKSFPRWKEDVLRQTRKPDEICIVDAASDDGTIELLRSWAGQDPRVRIEVKKSNPAQGRNLAVAMSSGEVIVSTDMGCRLDESWFAEMCKPFEEDSEVMVVAGNFGADMDTIRTSAAWADYYLSNGYRIRLGPGFKPSNRSVAYRRWSWDQLGGLPEDLTFASDDTVMSTQLLASGLKVAYAKNAYVYWARHEKLSGFWKESYRYGYGNGEAHIIRTPLTWLATRSWPKIAIYLLAVITIPFGVTLPAILSAFRNRRFGIMLLIPVLKLGNKIYYVRGFIEGSKHGALKCRNSRTRLAKFGMRSSPSHTCGKESEK